uniref:Fibronectin type-III domain-containing protein n=1 Tax=Sinocyclocheilus rhinocerous TaxID=307959 RepID=A0A673MP25_9TELE
LVEGLLWSAAGADARKPGDEFFSASVYRARCASRCLSLHITRISAAFKHFQSNGSLVWCQNHKQCSKVKLANKSEPVKGCCSRGNSTTSLTVTSDPCAPQVAVERALLSDVRPSRWYQFRVAAVNVHGTRGFTAPSKHFRSSRDPSPPPAPSGLSVSNITVGPDGLLTVRISWTLPAEPDLPVHHYKIYWSWTIPGKSLVPSRRKRRKTSDGARSSVDLEGLQANSSYSVEVQAVSYWGQIRLKSSKASVQFNTQLHNQTSADKLTDSNICADFIQCYLPFLSAGALEVGTPYYQDAQLQVRIYWKKRGDAAVNRYHVQWMPEYCSYNRSGAPQKSLTQENFINLPGLLFSCKYRVTVHMLSAKRRSKDESISFLTPSCATLQSKSVKPIACPGDTPLAKVLAKPENLTASFSFRDGNVTARFLWRVSRSQPLQPVTGFQVTWAEVSSASRPNSLPNSIISQSQILPPDRNLLVVSNLQLATFYRLEVQVITAAGEGPATKKIFQTPLHGFASGHRFYIKHQLKINCSKAVLGVTHYK